MAQPRMRKRRRRDAKTVAHGNVYPDPDIQHGSFRVFPRTDGGYVIVDERRKPGRRTVGGKFRELKEADRTAAQWHKEGHG